MPEKTTRQRIVDVLASGEHTARELATLVEVPLSRLLFELEHVARTHRRELEVRPARCLDCGFEFAKRTRLAAPSRCPLCRSERTEGPFLRLEVGTRRSGRAHG